MNDEKKLLEKLFYLIRLPFYIIGAVLTAIILVPLIFIFFLICWAFVEVFAILSLPFVFIVAALENDTKKIKEHLETIRWLPFKTIVDTIKEIYEELHNWLEHGG